MDLLVDIQNNCQLLADLYSEDPNKCFQSVVHIKNFVIGSNRNKESVIKLSIIPRLIQLIDTHNATDHLLAKEVALTIASLAKGTEQHIKVVIDSGIVALLLENTKSGEINLVEACLRALRSIFCGSSEPPIDLIYEKNAIKGDNWRPIIPHLLSVAVNNQSFVIKECVANIMAISCQTEEHQNILKNYGSVGVIGKLLANNVPAVQLASLRWLYRICDQNKSVSYVAVNEYFGEQSIPDLLFSMMSQLKTNDIQLMAAKCMTYLYRSGALNSDDKRNVFRTLNTLVRMCKKDKEPNIRTMGADTLAYLIEIDINLQRTASFCDHLIQTLTEFFEYKPNCMSLLGCSHSVNNHPITAAIAMKLEQELTTQEDGLKQAAFKALTFLGADDEEVRKRIIQTDHLMGHILSGLSDPNVKTRLSALSCLHNLSRSVQQYGSAFQDGAIWTSLRDLLSDESHQVLSLAVNTLCNLLLEFSPNQQHFEGAVERLCGLTRREEAVLRMYGVRVLTNMAFMAHINVKSKIRESLGMDQILRLLSDSDDGVLMKTLELLKNLLSNKEHIDHIMKLCGEQVMPALILILEGDQTSDLKEQVLNILANIANGDSAKNFIMFNEGVLLNLASYMKHSNVELQIGATICVLNLVRSEEDGSIARQQRLHEMGFQNILQELMDTNDITLFEKVNTALMQFNI